MSLPPPDLRDPTQAARTTVSAARFHDVVVGASKLLHGTEPDDSDNDALRWALELLDSAASTDVLFAMPSSRQLATGGGTVSAIRRAARSSKSELALDRVRDDLEAALNGRRDDQVVQSMAGLRMLFTIVSHIALQTEVQRASERETDPWPPRSTPVSRL
jgi:hypothetical protein